MFKSRISAENPFALPFGQPERKNEAMFSKRSPKTLSRKKSDSAPDLFRSRPSPPETPSRLPQLLPSNKILPREQFNETIQQSANVLKEGRYKGNHTIQSRLLQASRPTEGSCQASQTPSPAEIRRQQEDQWEQEFRSKLEKEFRSMPEVSHPSRTVIREDSGGGLHEGSEVELHDLCETAALNGIVGTCTKWHARSGRWDVLLQNGETVRLKEKNIRKRSAIASGQPSQISMPNFQVGDFVELHGLRARPELNGMRGRCTAWDVGRKRWEVRVDGAVCENLSVQPGNLRLSVCGGNPTPTPMALRSNDGWQGKSVHSWLVGDAQEPVNVNETGGRVAITVRKQCRERVVCTNLAGMEVAVIELPWSEVTFKEIYEDIAKSVGCDVGDIQLLTVDGQAMLGLDHWTLAEASLQ